MSPKHPCGYCGSRHFSWIERARVKLTSHRKISLGDELEPVISILVCNGCGHTAWFMADHKGFLADMRCEPRTVPEDAYR
jgi:hypothetical protein